MALDTEKMVRQLSLIALLHTSQRELTTRQVRQHIDAYAQMTDDAFGRRFYEDRQELAHAGITIEQLTTDPNETEPEVAYRFAHHGPGPLDFTGPERQALSDLRDGLGTSEDFPHAEALRVGVTTLLGDALATTPAPGAITVAQSTGPQARRRAALTARLLLACQQGKRVRFTYHDQQRTVDPYDVIEVDDHRYLIAALSDAPQQIRSFRLSRITSDISFASRLYRDFTPRTDTQSLPMSRWQMGPTHGTATITVAPDTVDYVLQTARGAARRGTAPGEITTRVSDPATFAGWILTLKDLVHDVRPGWAAQSVRDARRRIQAAHDPARAHAPQHVHPAPAAATAPVTRKGIGATGTRPSHIGRILAIANTLFHAARTATPVTCDDLKDAFAVNDRELRDDLQIINLACWRHAEYLMCVTPKPDGRLEIDLDAYADTVQQPLLTIEQRDAVLAGARLLANLDPHLQSAAHKIIAAHGTRGPLAVEDPRAAQITHALTHRSQLRVRYLTATGTITDRTLHPAARQHRGGRSYLLASEHPDGPAKTFRLDRMLLAQATDDPATPPPVTEPAWWETLAARTRSTRATIDNDAPWLAEDYTIIGRDQYDDYIVEIPYASTDWLCGQILAAGGRLRVHDTAVHQAISDLTATPPAPPAIARAA